MRKMAKALETADFVMKCATENYVTERIHKKLNEVGIYVRRKIIEKVRDRNDKKEQNKFAESTDFVNIIWISDWPF